MCTKYKCKECHEKGSTIYKRTPTVPVPELKRDKQECLRKKKCNVQNQVSLFQEGQGADVHTKSDISISQDISGEPLDIANL